MRLILLPLVALVSLFLLAACNGTSDEHGLEETTSGRLLLGSAEDRTVVERGVALRGRTLVMDGQQGALHLTGTDDAAAELAFTKIGRGRNPADAEQVLQRIAVEEAGDDEVYQYMMRADEPNLSRVEVEGTVPHESRLHLTMQSGPVVVDSVRGPMTIRSANGSVTITKASAGVEVNVRNGSIITSFVALDREETVELHTENGDITVRLAEDIEADIEAETDSGEIATRGLSFTERALAQDGAGYRFEGRLGTGGATLDLRTKNGTITISGLEDGDDRPRPIDHQAFPEELYPTDPAPPPADTTDPDTVDADAPQVDTTDADAPAPDTLDVNARG